MDMIIKMAIFFFLKDESYTDFSKYLAIIYLAVILRYRISDLIGYWISYKIIG